MPIDFWGNYYTKRQTAIIKRRKKAEKAWNKYRKLRKRMKVHSSWD